MREESASKSKGFLLLYFFGFLLLWEWLKPLGELTDTGNLSVFVAFTAICLAIKFFNLSRILRLSIITIYILVTIHRFYFKTDVLIGIKWISKFLQNLFDNTALLLTRQGLDITNDFKTLLFFLLLYLMTYLITYWLVIRKTMFLFFLVTVIYITVLDTFTPYHADSAIVRLTVIGFCILGIQTFYRILEKEKISFSVSYMSKWMIPLVMLIAFSAVLGFSGPKQKATWPDPVPFIKSYSDKVSGQQTVSTVGYGENDDRLGGAFESDGTVVFRAKASIRHYWKVENKDFYTGKGWEAVNNYGNPPIRLPQNENLYFFRLPNKKKTNFKATVTVNRRYKHIPYPEPMGLIKIKAKDAGFFNYDVTKEKILPFGSNQKPAQLNKFTVEYELPRYDVGMLRKVNGITSITTEIKLPEDQTNVYLQMPSTVPQRVKNLAAEITKGKNNWFDKAKAIEAYFDRNEYVYDQKKVPFPKENQDYVDQFLFETKTGYCDNFSTAMVVMLRSLEIPARWAKGYSDGEFIRSQGSQNLYEITNNKAHSWVEVFFPGSGWVPFEPTKGFTNSARFQYPNSAPNSVQAAVPQTEQKRGNTLKPETEDIKKPASSKQGFAGSVKQKWEENKFRTSILLVILSLTAWRIYRTRGKWIPSIWLLFYKNRKQETNFHKTYPILLNELNRYGLRRPEGQTLREYANYVDSFFYSMDMKRLTGIYERMIYKGDLKGTDWAEVNETWKRLMKKTIA